MTVSHAPKSFAYLIQGKSGNVRDFAKLNSINSDVYALTYDEPLHAPDFTSTLFRPKSTWAEGRNYLLSLVPKKYDYYIFLDDDVVVESGSFKLFEQHLLDTRPAVGLPLVDDIYSTFRYNSKLVCHTAISFDQIVQAFRCDVINDARILPYETCYDYLSWWYSCEIHQLSVLSYYSRETIQFNDFKIRNGAHYTKDPEASPASSYISGTGTLDHELIFKHILERDGIKLDVPFTRFGSFFSRNFIFSESGLVILQDNIKKLRDLEIYSAFKATVKYIVSIIFCFLYESVNGKIFQPPIQEDLKVKLDSLDVSHDNAPN